MILLKRLLIQDFKLLRRVELRFPRQGAVLVEGLNESGKSTLFESVFYGLYGVPLVTEGRGRGNLESVIRYGADSVSVELVVEVDEVELVISRSMRRGRSSQATLTVRQPGTPEEVVSGVQAVNARVVEELGGLDGEALLNSCFVEQKKLSKLEDLAPAQRKESLRRLLNLEKLTDLAASFRVTAQDERELVDAKDRLELAKLSARLPGLARMRSDLDAAMAGVAVAGSLPLNERDAIAEEARAYLESEPSGQDDATPWQLYSTRLENARGAESESRRRGLVLALVAGGSVALVAVVALLGMPLALLGIAFSAVTALMSAREYRSAAAASAEMASMAGRLAVWRDAQLAGAGEMEGRRRRLEERLGVDGSVLIVQEWFREANRLSRRMQVRRRAAALIEGAMERIVRMVLPNTERNLGQILPQLTEGRYHEARIGDDYQVQVWDDAAERYVSKAVFSGGARDQFSLALRLSFALATLPQELGSTPGFLFLDEPLSSFDVPRTEALVRLITSGQVAANFSQIFVISHNRSFDLASFPYRIVMRDGRVVESNLPS